MVASRNLEPSVPFSMVDPQVSTFFREHGWVFVHLHAFFPQWWETFVDTFRDVPHTPDEKEGGRHRRLTRFLLREWSRELASIPAQGFVQGEEQNPEHGGVERFFPSLTPQQILDPFFRELHFAILDISQNLLRPPAHSGMFRAGTHLIAYNARPGSVAHSTPRTIHYDEEIVTSIFNLVFHNIEGGENAVYARGGGEKLFEAVLQPGQGLILDDRRVSHCITPMTVAPGCTHGQRIVLLLDYCPLVVMDLRKQLLEDLHRYLAP